MNKSELVAKVAAATDYPKAVTTEIIDGVLAQIRQDVEEGQTVQLVGFGSFVKVLKAARDFRNPKTQAVVHKKAHNVVRFKPSKTFLGE